MEELIVEGRLYGGDNAKSKFLQGGAAPLFPALEKPLQYLARNLFTKTHDEDILLHHLFTVAAKLYPLRAPSSMS